MEKKPEKRSKTALIVKNIPHSTENSELRDLFARFGDLSRIVLPPTKTMALVEFDEASEARKAFRQLAYSKFKNQPIYLEWAPVDIFDAPPAAAAGAASTADTEAGKTKPAGSKKDVSSSSSSESKSSQSKGVASSSSTNPTNSKHQVAPDSVPAHQALILKKTKCFLRKQNAFYSHFTLFCTYTGALTVEFVFASRRTSIRRPEARKGRNGRKRRKLALRVARPLGFRKNV